MVSSGAQAQLALRGPQDTLTMSPKEVSFFRAVYTRCTNFASAESYQSCNNTPALGRTNIQTTMSRAGDLLSQQYIAVTVPRIDFTGSATWSAAGGHYTTWANGIGFAMIDEITAQIGQHDFDTHDGVYMYCREQLAAKSDRQLAEEVGLYEDEAIAAQHSLVPQQLYIPMQMWYNNFLEQSLPMIGLYWHELRIDLNLKPASALLATGWNGHGTPVALPSNITDLYYVNNFQYLDRAERSLFANQKLEYIFMQVQYLGEETFLATDRSKTVNIRWNQPVTDQFWVFMKESSITGNRPFDFGGIEYTAGYAGSSTVFVAPPYMSAQIFLNTHDRTLALPSEYMSSIPAHRAHYRIPRNKFIGSYCYGADVNGLLHSGSVNFSRMDSATMTFNLWPSTAQPWAFSATAPAAPISLAYAGRVRIYARNFNLAKASIGMMGVKFAA